MNDDTDFEATAREVLANPIARAAYDRAKVERRRRLALHTFRRAMRRYEKRARAFGMHSFPTTLVMVREDVPRMDAENMAKEEARLRRAACSVDEWLTPRGYANTPLHDFLCERAADAIAKLRATLTTVSLP